MNRIVWMPLPPRCGERPWKCFPFATFRCRRHRFRANPNGVQALYFLDGRDYAKVFRYSSLPLGESRCWRCDGSARRLRLALSVSVEAKHKAPFRFSPSNAVDSDSASVPTLPFCGETPPPFSRVGVRRAENFYLGFRVVSPPSWIRF